MSNKTKSRRSEGVRRKRKTRVRGDSNNKKSEIVVMFLEMLNIVKLYHWKTRSYAQHKATDELYSRLNEHIDTFIEVLLGKDQSRIQLVEREIKLMDYSDTKDFQNRVLVYRGFLTDMNIYFDSSRDTDLLNVRDEILGDVNQFLYLMSFDK
jgi:hypothetical protein